MVFVKAIWNWIWRGERRKHRRLHPAPLAAFYWEPAAARSHPVKDISRAGMYLLTEDRWYTNTLVTMTLARTDAAAGALKRSVRVITRVIRSGEDGVAVAFVWPRKSEQAESGVDARPSVDRFLDEVQASYVSTLASVHVTLYARTLALCSKPGPGSL